MNCPRYVYSEGSVALSSEEPRSFPGGSGVRFFIVAARSAAAWSEKRNGARRGNIRPKHIAR